VQIWDEIENQLNNPKFWAFISNESLSKYSNKIEYLFDIITKKKPGEKDPLYSFIHFFEEKADSLWSKWIEVEEIYRSLAYWYSNKNLYHKIGYLICSKIEIGHLMDLKKNNNKNVFENKINELIAEKIPEIWEELSYDNRSEHEKITNVLLLTNIELTRSNRNSNEFFPFDMYKNISKSLEHIHAQNIEDIDVNKKEQWINWLEVHAKVLLNIATDRKKAEKVIREVEEIIPKIVYEDFKRLSEIILRLIPSEEINESEYLHKIQNMALLGHSENASLSNSIFEVKRRKIIEMDKAGAFIPLATKRIFLRYYSSENSHNSSIWTNEERMAYLKTIKDCVEEYKPINSEANEK